MTPLLFPSLASVQCRPAGVKALASYLAKNFLSTLAGLYLLLQLGVSVHAHPGSVFEQNTLDKGAGAVLLIAAQDPAKFRALLKKVTPPPVPTSGTDGSPERND